MGRRRVPDPCSPRPPAREAHGRRRQRLAWRRGERYRRSPRRARSPSRSPAGFPHLDCRALARRRVDPRDGPVAAFATHTEPAPTAIRSELALPGRRRHGPLLGSIRWRRCRGCWRPRCSRADRDPAWALPTATASGVPWIDTGHGVGAVVSDPHGIRPTTTAEARFGSILARPRSSAGQPGEQARRRRHPDGPSAWPPIRPAGHDAAIRVVRATVRTEDRYGERHRRAAPVGAHSPYTARTRSRVPSACPLPQCCARRFACRIDAGNGLVVEIGDPERARAIGDRARAGADVRHLADYLVRPGSISATAFPAP